MCGHASMRHPSGSVLRTIVANMPGQVDNTFCYIRSQGRCIAMSDSLSNSITLDLTSTITDA